MYGHERWRSIYERRRAGAMNAEAARTAYVQLYAQGLRDLGYRHVQERQVLFHVPVMPRRRRVSGAEQD
jgi:hypothetical protein